MTRSEAPSRLFVALAVCIIAFSAVRLPPAHADRGLIGPSWIVLDESSQYAIVAWNGREEVLILSTNVQSSSDALALEIMPLPANPTSVTEGSMTSFTTLKEYLQALLGARQPSDVYSMGDGGVEIVFHDVLGAHDVTIVEVDEVAAFIEWVDAYAAAQQVEFAVSQAFRDAVQDYLDRGIRFFVFDAIAVTATPQSVHPLVYRFETDALYYPMLPTAASTLDAQSQASIHLFLITRTPVGDHLSYTSSSPDVADLFSGDFHGFYAVTSLQLVSALTTLTEDLVLTMPASTMLSDAATVLSRVLTALLLMCFLAPFAFMGVNAVTRRSKAISAIVKEYDRRLRAVEQRMHADLDHRSE